MSPRILRVVDSLQVFSVQRYKWVNDYIGPASHPPHPNASAPVKRHPEKTTPGKTASDTVIFPSRLHPPRTIFHPPRRHGQHKEERQHQAGRRHRPQGRGGRPEGGAAGGQGRGRRGGEVAEGNQGLQQEVCFFPLHHTGSLGATPGS